MKYLVATFVLLLSCNVWAAANVSDAPSRKKELPVCADASLIEQARLAIKKNQSGKVQTADIYDRRSRILALKNLHAFEELEVEGFSPRRNYTVADRLITLKINQHLNDADFRLCVSSNPLQKNQVYLLIYPQGQDIVAEVLNYKSSGRSSERLTFSYKK